MTPAVVYAVSAAPTATSGIQWLIAFDADTAYSGVTPNRRIVGAVSWGWYTVGRGCGDVFTPPLPPVFLQVYHDPQDADDDTETNDVEDDGEETVRGE